MSVSLVKSYFTAGWSTPGCLPESDPALFVTLDEARAYLADELDRAADEFFADELENARADYLTSEAYEADFTAAHEGSASISGSAGLVRSDPDGDIRASRGFHSVEPDGYAYWIEPAEL